MSIAEPFVASYVAPLSGIAAGLLCAWARVHSGTLQRRVRELKLKTGEKPVRTIRKNHGYRAFLRMNTVKRLVGPVRSRHHRKTQQRRIDEGIPFLVEMIRAGMQSGASVLHALSVVSEKATLAGVATSEQRPLYASVDQCVHEVSCGEPMADALMSLGKRGGGELAMVTTVLLSGDQYGAPLAASLRELAADCRQSQARRTEIRARQLSVSLLFPLAGCIFPAFALLTVVPLIAGSLKTLAVSLL